MAYKIKIKRCYESPSLADRARFLVDGLWSRGVRKEAIRLAGWVRGVAPSQKLRKWFGHDPKRWADFCKRYFVELTAKRATWMPILEAASKAESRCWSAPMIWNTTTQSPFRNFCNVD
jgi:uncharacterized protein YeaO (DUF488 family)